MFNEGESRGEVRVTHITQSKHNRKTGREANLVWTKGGEKGRLEKKDLKKIEHLTGKEGTGANQDPRLEIVVIRKREELDDPSESAEMSVGKEKEESLTHLMPRTQREKRSHENA